MIPWQLIQMLGNKNDKIPVSSLAPCQRLLHGGFQQGAGGGQVGGGKLAAGGVSMAASAEASRNAGHIDPAAPAQAHAQVRALLGQERAHLDPANRTRV